MGYKEDLTEFEKGQLILSLILFTLPAFVIGGAAMMILFILLNGECQ